MPVPGFIKIDGNPYLWRDGLRERRDAAVRNGTRQSRAP
jgi:hypothetical protein